MEPRETKTSALRSAMAARTTRAPFPMAKAGPSLASTQRPAKVPSRSVQTGGDPGRPIRALRALKAPKVLKTSAMKVAAASGKMIPRARGPPGTSRALKAQSKDVAVAAKTRNPPVVVGVTLKPRQDATIADPMTSNVPLMKPSTSATMLGEAGGPATTPSEVGAAASTVPDHVVPTSSTNVDSGTTTAMSSSESRRRLVAVCPAIRRIEPLPRTVGRTPRTINMSIELSTDESLTNDEMFDETMTLHVSLRTSEEIEEFIQTGNWNPIPSTPLTPMEEHLRAILRNRISILDSETEKIRACLEFSTKGTIGGRPVATQPEWMREYLAVNIE